ncbi:MAG: hypothetical protein WKG07_26080 [Hymenobacter sp.]
MTAASMGGQVARFRAGLDGAAGPVPQQQDLPLRLTRRTGARDIPLGVQCMINRLRNVLIGGSDFSLQRDKLLRPASQQMLVYRSTPARRELARQWQKPGGLRPAPYPACCAR